MLNSKPNENQMYGAITDIQVWDKSLSMKEINEWSKCQKSHKGNVFNWDLNMKGKNVITLPFYVCIYVCIRFKF